MKWPARVPGGYRSDVAGAVFGAAVHGAEGGRRRQRIGGIRLPEQAVPLAALTGWQFRSERIGAPNVLIAMAGAYIPLPKDAGGTGEDAGPAAVDRGALRIESGVPEEGRRGRQ